MTELRKHARALIPLLLALLVLVAGCSSSSVQRDPDGEASAVAAREKMHAAILDAYREGRTDEARAMSVQLLEQAPDFHAASRLRLQIAMSYHEEARWDLALHHLGLLLEDYPRSTERWQGILLKAEALAQTGRRLEAAAGIDRALENWPENAWRERTELYLAGLLDRGLTGTELEEWLRRRPRSPMRARASLALAENYMREHREREARPLLETVAADPRLGELQERASQLLARLGLESPEPGDLARAMAREGVIGVLAPISGRYSVYGEAFLDGARLALANYNSSQLTRFELVVGDTKGDPVSAALATRQLIEEYGVSSLLGAVLTNSTIAAAVEANASQVPMLSPAATAENIHTIGPWIFQNNITSEAQVLALARLAIFQLLHSRFAVLYPKQGNGMELARVFAETVNELGGEIVANLAYDVGMTDFSEGLGQIRDAQPEVLFLPGEVDQLELIIPQLAYHDIYGQVLGNEAWNSRRLARRGGKRIEGAIFPSDVLLKRDRALYREFLRLHEGRYTAKVNPIAARSFLGMTTLLEIMGDGALGRDAIRSQLSIRLADVGDEDARRESLANQVTLMTIRDGEIVYFGNQEFFDPEESAEPFIDRPWSP